MTPPAHGIDCISPGLALVDPDLAAAARALLPEPGEFRPNWKEPTIPPAPPRKPRLRHPVIVAALVIVTTLVAGGLDHTLTQTRSVVANPPPAAGIQHENAARASSAARTYRWPSVPGAQSYDLRLLKGTDEIYKVTTPTLAAALPATLHLAAGRYTWSVTPNLGDVSASTSAPVVEGTFEATSAS